MRQVSMWRVSFLVFHLFTPTWTLPTPPDLASSSFYYGTTIDYDLADFDEFGVDPSVTDISNIDNTAGNQESQPIDGAYDYNLGFGNGVNSPYLGSTLDSILDSTNTATNWLTTVSSLSEMSEERNDDQTDNQLPDYNPKDDNADENASPNENTTQESDSLKGITASYNDISRKGTNTGESKSSKVMDYENSSVSMRPATEKDIENDKVKQSRGETEVQVSGGTQSNVTITEKNTKPETGGTKQTRLITDETERRIINSGDTEPSDQSIITKIPSSTDIGGSMANENNDDVSESLPDMSFSAEYQSNPNVSMDSSNSNDSEHSSQGSSEVLNSQESTADRSIDTLNSDEMNYELSVSSESSSETLADSSKKDETASASNGLTSSSTSSENDIGRSDTQSQSNSVGSKETPLNIENIDSNSDSYSKEVTGSTSQSQDSFPSDSVEQKTTGSQSSNEYRTNSKDSKDSGVGDMDGSIMSNDSTASGETSIDYDYNSFLLPSAESESGNSETSGSSQTIELVDNRSSQSTERNFETSIESSISSQESATNTIDSTEENTVEQCFKDDDVDHDLCGLVRAVKLICIEHFPEQCFVNTNHSTSGDSQASYSVETIESVDDQSQSYSSESETVSKETLQLDSLSASIESVSGISQLMSLIKSICPELCKISEKTGVNVKFLESDEDSEDSDDIDDVNDIFEDDNDDDDSDENDADTPETRDRDSVQPDLDDVDDDSDSGENDNDEPTIDSNSIAKDRDSISSSPEEDSDMYTSDAGISQDSDPTNLESNSLIVDNKSSPEETGSTVANSSQESLDMNSNSEGVSDESNV